MYCKNCGKKVSDDANFCEYCGYTIRNFGEPVTEKKKSNKKKIIIIISVVVIVVIAAGIFWAWNSFVAGGASNREGAFKKTVQAVLDEDYEAYNMMCFPKEYEDDYYGFIMTEHGMSKEDDKMQLKEFMSGIKQDFNNENEANIVSVESLEVIEEKITKDELSDYVEYFANIGIIDDIYVMAAEKMDLKDDKGKIHSNMFSNFITYKIDGRWYGYILYSSIRKEM